MMIIDLFCNIVSCEIMQWPDEDFCLFEKELILGDSGTTCKDASHRPYLLASNSVGVYKLSQWLYTDTTSEIAYTYDSHRAVMDMDYDPVTKSVYLADNREGSIVKLDIVSRKLVPILQNIDNLRGFSIDWLNKKIYWVDCLLDGYVGVSSLDGLYSAKLNTDVGSKKCRFSGVAVSPKGSLVISCSWPDARIIRCALDGSVCTVLVEDLHDPTSLQFDQRKIVSGMEAETVYWTDSRSNTIESINLDGKNRVTHQFAQSIGSIFVSDSALYRCDVGNDNSLFVTKNFATEYIEWDQVTVAQYEESSFNRGHLVVLSYGWTSDLQNSYDPCSQSHCDHLCVVGERNSAVCLCPEGKVLSAHEGCVNAPCSEGELKCDGNCLAKWRVCNGRPDCEDGSDESSNLCDKCPSDEFACGNWYCIGLSNTCDGIEHCSDGSDERDCETTACRNGHTHCDDKKQCISDAMKCDGRTDCSDGSDEIGCSCDANNYMCESGPRICRPNDTKCDGREDCEDGSDETGCPKLNVASCGDLEFKCSNSKCIDSSRVCDETPDCPEGEDETDPSCTSRSVQKCSGGSCRVECSVGERKCGQTDVCITERQMCDGVTHCADESDEMYCPVVQDVVLAVGKDSGRSSDQYCSQQEFTCGDGE